MTRRALCVSAVLCGCPAPTGPDDPLPDVPSALVLSAAFTGDAVLAAIELESLAVHDDQLALLGSDWGIAWADGDPVVLGRYQIDVLRRYDGLDLRAPTWEASAGDGANPQGVVSCAGVWFVPRLGPMADGRGDVGVFDPDTGEELGAVNLDAYAEGADGDPEPQSAVHFDGRVYVALGRLDQNDAWAADPVGKIVAIDCASRTVSEHWDVGPNPSFAASDTSVLVRADDGLWRIDDGGATRIWDPGEATLRGAAEVGDALVLVVEDEASTTLRCGLDGPPFATALGWAYSVDLAPDGRAWIAWRDHWRTEGLDPSGIAVIDVAACAADGDWLQLRFEPSAVALPPR